MPAMQNVSFLPACMGSFFSEGFCSEVPLVLGDTASPPAVGGLLDFSNDLFTPAPAAAQAAPAVSQDL